MNDLLLANKEVIERFYSAFQKLDYKTMQLCYSEDALFSDPVFGMMNVDETRAMWEMLCKRAKDFSLEFGNIELLDEEYATCSWTATYVFSATGRKVTNRIKAHMRIRDGKIIEHSDAFPIYKWMQMAFGVKGLLLGWTGFMIRKVQRGARMNLEKFMQQKG